MDVLINNAGANTRRDRIVNINLDDLRYMFELNCVSAVGMIQETYPLMAQKQQGLIVNILTSCCLFINPMAGSYTASKDAMEGICRSFERKQKLIISVCAMSIPAALTPISDRIPIPDI